MRLSLILITVIAFLCWESRHTSGQSRLLNELDPGKKEQLFNIMNEQLLALSKEKQQVQREQKTNQKNPEDARSHIAQIARASTVVSETLDVLRGTSTPPEGDKLREVEEIIRWYTRPVWVVCGGLPWIPDQILTTEIGPGAQTYFEPVDFMPIIEPRSQIIQSTAVATGLVSRFDLIPNKGERDQRLIGTAIVIGDRHVVTNKHVVINGNIGYLNQAINTWNLYSGMVVKIEFPYEYNRCKIPPTPTKTVVVRGIKYVDTSLDFAILETDPGLPPKVTFDTDDNSDPGDHILVIGYPSRPPDGATFLSPAQIDLVFRAPNGRTPFPALRIAAGIVARDSTAPKGYFSHDATTWGGNSGSVVINLATGKVTGLHARGLERITEKAGNNEAVFGTRIAEIIAKMGL